ncbi:hypothetical protein [Nitrosopumilus sp.]|uniref:hypothetical protein n=1 Tax=Nitrosopumilus sp. TaxID=2024843 RepID=UPI00247CB96A|nr:hypothetical protein [Nitrosopumilus sp.]MCV0409629.1 hypothetical protein [Nitrosopumilus sp.]
MGVVGMNSKILLVSSLSAISFLGVFVFLSINNDDLIKNNMDDGVVVNLESYAYEDVCGYPVTDEMRLDLISRSSWSHDSFPYLKGHPGHFTHVILSRDIEAIPVLQYQFELDSGKHVSFEMDACNLDSSKIGLIEYGPTYLKPQSEYGDAFFNTISVPGNPMVQFSTMQPVLDAENCQRVAKYYTTLQSHTMFTRENVTFDPIWKDQVFPLMDYCNDAGDFKMDIIDEKLKWSFVV